MKPLKLASALAGVTITATLLIIANDRKLTDDDPKIVDTSPRSDKPYEKYALPILILPFDELPYHQGARKRQERPDYDDNSVPLYRHRGRLLYHPVYMTEYALHLIDVYNSTQNAECLERAKSIARKLLALSLPTRSSLFFPYTFDFPLHGYPGETLRAPWYSAMAQGEALSLLVRLYEITNEESYLQSARKVFKSFGLCESRTTCDPWVSCVDGNGFLWLEEYPHDPPAYTLNGMIFAMFGVYDYYRVTRDPESEDILRGTLVTIKENIHRFRNRNGFSHYCLRHPKILDRGYHHTHIRQLRMLHKMTGDPAFLRAANQFVADARSIERE